MFCFFLFYSNSNIFRCMQFTSFCCWFLSRSYTNVVLQCWYQQMCQIHLWWLWRQQKYFHNPFTMFKNLQEINGSNNWTRRAIDKDVLLLFNQSLKIFFILFWKTLFFWWLITNVLAQQIKNIQVISLAYALDFLSTYLY